MNNANGLFHFISTCSQQVVVITMVFDKWGDMPRRSLHWAGTMSGVALYSLVFIYAHRSWLMGEAALHGQPELLLFLVPGVVMAWLHVDTPLKSTLLIALLGTLTGAVMLNRSLLAHTDWVVMLVWSLSAVFWAGSGALLVRLLRIIWR